VLSFHHMNPNNNAEGNEVVMPAETSGGPRTMCRLNQVTPVSKVLAAIIFIMMPFLGAYVGYVYAPEKVVEVEKIITVEKNPDLHLDVDTVSVSDSAFAQASTSLSGTMSIFHDDEVGISFSYPIEWESIVTNDETNNCEDASDTCLFRTYAPANNPVAIFMAAQTESKPLSGRGGFWGDDTYRLNGDYLAECQDSAECQTYQTTSGLQFSKITNLHTCEDGMGCEGPGDYYAIYQADTTFPKIVLASYRFVGTDKDELLRKIVESVMFD
jgi:hypothetical protein